MKLNDTNGVTEAEQPRCKVTGWHCHSDCPQPCRNDGVAPSQGLSEFPPLPKHAGRMPWEGLRFGKPGFTADQMREYVLADRAARGVAEGLHQTFRTKDADAPMGGVNE